GSGRVNINTAPEAVLRALPGMTDQTLFLILQMRSQGRRIDSPQQVFAAEMPRGRAGAGANPLQGLQNALSARVTAQTTEVELTIDARVGPQASPTRLIVVMARADGGAVVRSQQW